MDASSLAALLAAKDKSPVLALGEAELADVGSYGPAAYSYLALWLSAEPGATAKSEQEDRARLLYRMAFDRGSGLVRSEAGLALISRLKASARWEELLSFGAEYRAAAGADWPSERARLEALDTLGRADEEAALAVALPKLYPAECSKDAEALAYFAAAAAMRQAKAASSGREAWAKSLRSMALEKPASEWTARACALARSQPRLAAAFSPEELHALAMREAVWRRDYGTAAREAALAPKAALSRAASQAMAADAGKAFLYSSAAKEGEPLFAALEASAAKKPLPTGSSAGIGWTALYYRGRLARAREGWGEATALFSRAAASAPTKADADSARWYAADCAYRGALAAAAAQASALAQAAAEEAARTVLLEALVAASGAWRDPASFADLADGLYRDALRARDWRLLESMADRLGPRLARDGAARLAYTAARAEELGLGFEPGADPERRESSAKARFASLAIEPRAPAYYRALAAWRSGMDISLAASPSATGADAAPAAFAAIPAAPAEPNAPEPDPRGEAETYVSGMASFGLYEPALAEARARRSGLDDPAMRRIIAHFAFLGRPDCALRLELELSSRPSFAPDRADFETLYPRPYLAEIRSLQLDERLPEALALGLVRSESVFRADAVSRAGAVGLSQLMPATAAEQARALGLKSYDLKAPKDNLAIGLAYFAGLLDRADGRFLRAMMSYNAGSGRLKAWLAESGDLPDDLLVEAIGIDETRQYCRNILQSTAIYGELYYGRGIGETAGALVEGKAGPRQP
jgi:soluble lytic murein transglycosylase